MRREPIETWLRKRTSHLDYGYKWDNHPIHCNDNDTVVEFLLHQRHWLHKMTNDKFARHFSGEETFYCAGNSYGPETLFMVDIDCHKRGSLAGAMAFAQHLADTFLPGLYFEKSTNGKGVHGFALAETSFCDAEEVNALLLELGKALDEYLMLHPYDVEMVEIKGLSPVVSITNRRLTNYKAGTLAKLPRAKDRFEELKATTRLSIPQLADLIQKIKTKSVAASPISHVAAWKKARRPACGSVRGTHIDINLLPKYIKLAQTILGVTNEQEKQEKLQPQRRRHSTYGAWQTDAFLITANTSRSAEENGGSRQGVLRTTGRAIVTAEDLGIFLMELRFFSRNMNQDGSLPTERFRALWEAMLDKGDIARAWDYKRHAAMRNYLSSLGWLTWEDERYSPGCGRQKGQAAKWRASDELLELLKSVEEEEEEEEEEDEDTSLAGQHQ